jgi:anaerobic magnesium-protoporphyrin IX monomethyl ester cyclase
LRVTLVKPPEQSRMNFGTFSLAVLASAVTDIASVNILDATTLSIEEATTQIIQNNPDAIGITTMGLESVNPVCTLVEAIRQKGFKQQIVVGGHGASMLPQRILQSGANVVVYGEGELTFREILQSGISDRIQGIYLPKDGHLFKTTQRGFIDLDELKEPARNLCPSHQSSIHLLETSRGCPHSCSFCETSRFFSCTWRGRSPSHVVKDIHKLVEGGAMIIQIADDNFTANPQRVLEICRLLKNEQLPLFFLFSARSDDLSKNPKLIPALAKANFLRASIGVETVIPKIAESIGKNISFKQHIQTFEALKKAGIFTVASFIVGLPGENENMRKSYVELALKLADSATFLPFQPFPGTPMAKGVGESEDWCVEYAAKLTREFSQHPVSIERLTLAAKEATVRGMLSRASLQNRLTENIRAK